MPNRQVPFVVELEKDGLNRLGITISGGPPHCPVTFITKVDQKRKVLSDAGVEPGDEVLEINGQSAHETTKRKLAEVVQKSEGKVKIKLLKLETDFSSGYTFDVFVKSIKQEIVEHMSTRMVDFYGLSRAVLVGDVLVKKLENLEKSSKNYEELMRRMHKVLLGYKEQATVHRQLADVFTGLSECERDESTKQALKLTGESHRQLSKCGLSFIRETMPIISSMKTYLTKALPDMRASLKKYCTTKVEFLTYCLKVKEMDDEEAEHLELYMVPMDRVRCGNYQYRVFLRCRHVLGQHFATQRTSIVEKLEMLNTHRVQDISFQLERFITAMEHYTHQASVYQKGMDVFPITPSVDLMAVPNSNTEQRRSSA